MDIESGRKKTDETRLVRKPFVGGIPFGLIQIDLYVPAPEPAPEQTEQGEQTESATEVVLLDLKRRVEG